MTAARPRVQSMNAKRPESFCFSLIIYLKRPYSAGGCSSALPLYTLWQIKFQRALRQVGIDLDVRIRHLPVVPGRLVKLLPDWVSLVVGYPHFDLGEVVFHFWIFGNEQQFGGVLPCNFFLPFHSDVVTLRQFSPGGAKSQQQKLVQDVAVFADLVILITLQVGIVDPDNLSQKRN